MPSDNFLSIFINQNDVDANIYISLVSLTGVLIIGIMQVYYARTRATKYEMKRHSEEIKQIIQDQINKSVLEGNIARMLDLKLKPIEEDIREIKHKLDRIEERD
jgi:nitrogen regulatory protein PII-like uncharacterized protein